MDDEAAAAELDADSDDDVLAVSRVFDLLALLEDELIMAQPLVPRPTAAQLTLNGICVRSIRMSPPPRVLPEESGASPSFAALAALKRTKTEL